jgi:hypothetical protein
VSSDSERGGDSQPALTSEQTVTYMGMQWAAHATETYLSAAWKRPTRHNRSIERAALWYALHVTNDCAHALEHGEQNRIARPATGDATSRYDAKAAITTIPTLFPYTTPERRLLTFNQDRRTNFRFEYGIGDTALGQIALLERWHDWLWTPPTRSADRCAHPAADAELLAAACNRLTDALEEVLVASTYDRHEDQPGVRPSGTAMRVG